MIELKTKEDCCGCTACASVCPTNSIEMTIDEEGFLYPKINLNLCINCQLCNKVCPVQNEIKMDKFERKGFVLRVKNRETLQSSTSGGFFTSIANWIIKNQGVVCAASFDENFNVTHTLLKPEDYSDSRKIKEILLKYMGSKYVQSDLGDSYKNIKKYLDADYKVCFIGTTCQVYGLKCYLGKEYKKLFTIDLVCHGTPSPKLWRKYLEFEKNKMNCKPIKINFRSKKFGYHNGVMEIDFENNKKHIASARTDLMLKCFFNEIASRPICYKCPFKVIDRCSDLTAYDCWHFSQLVKNVPDDDKGYTNIIVHSEKGNKILNEIKPLIELYEVDLEKAIKLDGIMIKESAKAHRKRNEFYKDIDATPLDDHVQKYLPINLIDYFIEFIKILFYRIGILKYLKLIKKMFNNKV